MRSNEIRVSKHTAEDDEAKIDGDNNMILKDGRRKTYELAQTGLDEWMGG